MLEGVQWVFRGKQAHFWLKCVGKRWYLNLVFKGSLVLKPQDGCESWWGRFRGWVRTGRMGYRRLTKEEWKDVDGTLVMIQQ